jgi:hypothetical protein
VRNLSSDYSEMRALILIFELQLKAAAELETRIRPSETRFVRSLTAVFLFGASLSAAELPDISSVPPDLTVPPMTSEIPAAGRRVRQVTPGWEATQVYHALFLPRDWEAGGRYPIIVEWAGNGDYRNAFGDVSTGRVEGSNLGYGMTGGEKCLWVCLPYLNGAGMDNVIKWWGDAPAYDPEPTLRYARATVRHLVEKYGGDTKRVVLAGFSRGAIAVNYLGLHDDETASLWRAFVCYSHYDGVRTWPYPGSDRASAQGAMPTRRNATCAKPAPGRPAPSPSAGLDFGITMTLGYCVPARREPTCGSGWKRS